MSSQTVASLTVRKLFLSTEELVNAVTVVVTGTGELEWGTFLMAPVEAVLFKMELVVLGGGLGYSGEATNILKTLSSGSDIAPVSGSCS